MSPVKVARLKRSVKNGSPQVYSSLSQLDLLFRRLELSWLKIKWFGGKSSSFELSNQLFSGIVTELFWPPTWFPESFPQKIIFYFPWAVTHTDRLSVLFFTASLSSDVDMEVDHFTNGVTESSSNGFLNGSSKHTTEPDDCDADMGGLSAWLFSARQSFILLYKLLVLIVISFIEYYWCWVSAAAKCMCCKCTITLKHARLWQTGRGSAEVESAQSKRQLCGGSQAAIERMIHFGRELQSMSEHLRRECGKNSANKKMLKVTQKSIIVLAPCCEKHIDELYCIFEGKVHVPNNISAFHLFIKLHI